MSRGRPPKGSLPALWPRWVALYEYQGWHVLGTGLSHGRLEDRLLANGCDCAIIHPVNGNVTTYNVFGDQLHIASDIVDRILLFNQGGKVASYHWQVVDKIGIFRGYYVLVDFREQAIIETVAKFK